MTARMILPADAGRDEWLDARRHGVTASEIAALMGLSPYESPLSLYWRKKGQLPEDDGLDHDAKSLGRFLEAWVADKFAADHPEFYMCPAGLYAANDWPQQMATPDRVLSDASAVAADMSRDPLASAVADWEGKTSASYDEWGESGSDDIPRHYRAQVLWQIDVMDVPEARVTCLFLHSRQVRHYIITRDEQAEADLALMRDEAAQFLKRLDSDDPPPVDGHAATTDTLKALHPDLEDVSVPIGRQLTQRYRAALRNRKYYEQRESYYKNRILAELGNGRYATCDGEKVATRSVTERKGFYVAPTVMQKLTPAKEKK